MENEQYDLISIEELCERLQIGRSTAYTLLNSGKIPHAFRIKRKWKIPSASATEYIKREGKFSRF